MHCEGFRLTLQTSSTIIIAIHFTAPQWWDNCTHSNRTAELQTKLNILMHSTDKPTDPLRIIHSVRISSTLAALCLIFTCSLNIIHTSYFSVDSLIKYPDFYTDQNGKGGTSKNVQSFQRHYSILLLLSWQSRFFYKYSKIFDKYLFQLG